MLKARWLEGLVLMAEVAFERVLCYRSRIAWSAKEIGAIGGNKLRE